MRKEVVFAIILGLIMGGVIVVGLHRANSTTNKGTVSPTTESPASQPTDQIGTLLEITRPLNGEILFTPTATISGKTHAEARLVIVAASDEYFVKPDSDGSFQQTVDLDGGSNLIKIVAVMPDGKRQEDELTLVYTTELDPDDIYKK
jgi:hypothetical protein